MKKIWNCIIGIATAITLSACGSVSAPSAETGTPSASVPPVTESTEHMKTEASEPEASEPAEPATGQAALSMEDFWKPEGDTDGSTITFATGLEIILPEDWAGKTVLSTDWGPEHHPTSSSVFICEKTNAQAGVGGILFYLDFYLHEKGSEYAIFSTDKVLGTYKQGDAEYALIFRLPREMNYVEGDEAMKEAYESLSASVDRVLVKTDAVTDFTECDAEDLDWISSM